MRCEELLGRTIRFRDRIQCWECDEPDPYEICPDIDNPDNCPKKDYKLKIEKISLSRVRGENIYTINDEYEFPAGDFWKVVRIGETG